MMKDLPKGNVMVYRSRQQTITHLRDQKMC